MSASEPAAPSPEPDAPGLAERVRARFRRRWTRLSPAERQEVLDGLFPEGPDLVPFLWRYATLMTLSVIIATLGLVGDSAAVVIGAMLIAPLMMPVLALGAALAMAWPRRQAVAAALVVAGCGGGIAVAWAVSAVLHDGRFIELSGELLARTRPTMLDLGIGVAAGAAGAYVTVRSKAASAIPGVAIAVALVPPLAAVGITFQRGEHGLAGQALLLLLTNLATIVLAAALVFIATGFIPGPRAESYRHHIRLGVATALVCVLAVAYPLAAQTRGLVQEAEQRQQLLEEAESWIAGRELEVTGLALEPGDRSRLTLELVGSDEPPPVRTLAGRVAEAIDGPVELTVHFTPRRARTVRAG